MSKREEILNKVTDRLRELTINELFEAKGPYNSPINASGKLAGSIFYDGKPTSTGIEIGINMEDYGYAVEEGRPKSGTKGDTSWQPTLVQWIQKKGIKPEPGVTVEQLSYAIYKSINKKGYDARPFIEPALAAYDAVFADEWAEATAEDIEIDLKKLKGIE